MKGRAVAVIAIAGLLIASAAGEERTAKPPPRSGYTFLSPDLQALQDDDFRNPGLLWTEAGEEIWNRPTGSSSQSCASCHGDPKSSMRGVSARYPAYNRQARRVINLEQRINLCRKEQQHAEPLTSESQ